MYYNLYCVKDVFNILKVKTKYKIQIFKGLLSIFGFYLKAGKNFKLSLLLGILVLAPNSFHGSHVFLVIIIVAIA